MNTRNQHLKMAFSVDWGLNVKSILTALCCFVFILGINPNTKAQNAKHSLTQEVLVPGTDAYQAAKSAGHIQNQVVKLNSAKSTKGKKDGAIAQFAKSGGGCYIPHDPDTWTEIPDNDDGTSEEIDLPFTFSFYGESYNSVYINNNGNITFNSNFDTFTPEGFPISTPMIAPFWGDVDTRNDDSGNVWYLVTPNALYVAFAGVGYYDEAADLLNTFQVVITDGSSAVPEVGAGNNVAFFYGDMQWTTGDASNGTGGFGGSAATVGANSGNDEDFFQVGRFDMTGDQFNGAYGEPSGVDWLDYSCFTFNVSGEGLNIAPVLQEISSIEAEVCPGESTEINWTYTGPEQVQTVTVALTDPDGLGEITGSESEDGTTSGVLEITGTSPGEYTISLVATDDGDPVASTTTEIAVVVEDCGSDYDCPDEEAYFGDPCDDDDPNTVNDAYNQDCECVGEPVQVEECEPYAPECPVEGERWNASTANGDECGGNEGGHSIILNNLFDGVNKTVLQFVEGQAFWDEVGDMAILHGRAELTSGGNSGDYDFTGTLWDVYIPFQALEDGEPKLEFNNSCQDLQEDWAEDWYYYEIVEFANGHHITRASDNEGNCSDDYSSDYIDLAEASNTYHMQIGLGANGKNQNLGASDWFTFESSIDLSGDGCPECEALAFSNGNANGHDGDINIDLEPGDCGDPGEACPDYNVFYANHGPGVSGTDLYDVELSGSDALLTHLVNVNYEAHIGYNEVANVVYLVNANGSFIDVYDVANDTIDPANRITVAGGLGSLYAVVYNPADGLIYVGDASNDEVHTIDPTDGSHVLFASGIPINGGDLSLVSGKLFLATRSGDDLYSIMGGTATLVGSITDDVNGMATLENNNLIISNLDNDYFEEIDDDANSITTYDASLNGSPFTLKNGDMAAGCNPEGGGGEEECPNFRYFYIADNTQGYSQGTVFEGQIVGSDFELTELFSAGISAHLAVNASAQLLYVVAGSGDELRTYDLQGNLINNVDPGLSSTFAAVYNPSDGLVYVGSANQNKIYTVDPLNGNTELVADNVPVEGGDLVLDDAGQLYLVERVGGSPSNLYEISGGSANFLFEVATEANGAALTSAGGFIVAEGENTNNFWTYESDGSNETQLNAVLGGNPFPVVDGDMASGCFEEDPVIEECQDFRYYYLGYNTPGYGSGTVFAGNINGSDFELTQLFTAGYTAHLGVNEQASELYVVATSGNQVETYDLSGNLLNTASLTGLSSLTAVVWNSADQLLYVGSGSANEIHTVDPVTGNSSLFASGIPVQGGDLVIDDSGQLYVIERINNAPSKLYEVSGGSANFLFEVTQSANGAALTANNGFIVAEGNNSNSFWLYDNDGGNETQLNAVIGGNPFPVVDGDMASGCFDGDPDIVPGECYATCLAGQQYVEGTRSNGSMLPANRTDANKALGPPENDDTMNFVSLGYGGSITLCFGGAVLNDAGDDLEIVETSFGNPSCGGYPEYADIEVSQDGNTWYFLETICLDGAVDISDAPVALAYINYVRISNNDGLTQTSDGYDVDGVNVLSGNCVINPLIQQDEQKEVSIAQSDDNIKLKAYPNPTQGQAQVTFTVPVDTRVVLEVYNTSGVRVATLFNSYANARQEYLMDFDGSNLTEGLYMYRLTTGEGQIEIGKLLIY